MVMEVISVQYQQHTVGALSFNTDTGVGAFEYSRDFIQTGIELAPLTMPLAAKVYSFPELNFATFKGLPGLMADSLPDDFGNAVLNAWMASQGKSAASITPLQRLQYTGTRGMGALEYAPATTLKQLNAAQQVEIQELVAMAQGVLDARAQFALDLNASTDQEALLALLSVGTSAGGARPKAVVAFNQDFSQVRSGQTQVPAGFTHYLLKFDGVSDRSNQQETFGDPLGFGAMEYVYYLLATNCGIHMMPCRLLDEGQRRHFLTQRFDRVGNDKIHIQTLNGIAHVDFAQPGSFSYAELFGVARRLQLSAQDADQLLRRLIFNLVARNHDDHAKNFAFMLKDGRWQLAPAYDLAYSYKPGSRWVNSHWLTLNGKRDHFTRADLYSLQAISPMFTPKKLDEYLEHTVEQVSRWRRLATDHNVPNALIDEIEPNLRLRWL